MDDILDFLGTEEELGKPAGSDLSQGTLTLPAMLLNERYPKDNPVKRLFKNQQSLENVSEAIDQVRNSSIVGECYKMAKNYCDLACNSLKELPHGASLNSFKELAEFVVERKS